MPHALFILLFGRCELIYNRKYHDPHQCRLILTDSLTLLLGCMTIIGVRLIASDTSKRTRLVV